MARKPKRVKPTPLTVGALLAACDQWAPPGLAMDGDNVGLLAGDPAAAVEGVLLSTDLTRAVVAEALRRGCNVVICHHPPIYRPARRVRADDPQQAALLAALRGGLHLIALHTNYDAAAEGVNDVLAALVGLTDVRPLQPAAEPAGRVKLVVFTPAGDLASVQRAAFDAGAGRIGGYSECSFRVAGVGSFRGDEDTQPAVGRAGRREEVPEWRLEMIVPEPALPGVLAAVRKAHSYEEPAIDVIGLSPTAHPHGIGRVGQLDPPATVQQLARRVKTVLKAERVGVVGSLRRRVRTVAVVGGSGGQDIPAAAAAGAQLLITGEAAHHQAVAAAEAGLSLLLAGHWHTERPAMPALAPRLAARFAHLAVHVSRRDAPPVRYV
jgi:dinuclear metal center YbgI/SA1388 family protein